MPTRDTGYVPQDTPPDRSFTIVLHEGQTYLGNGVVYDGFLTNGQIPGPTLIMDEGEVVEIRVENRGAVPHGVSLHGAYIQTSKYLGRILPGETRSLRFRATHPGVFMYHCAPGGHAIPMHILGGQYGMMVIRPRNQTFRLEEELGHPPNLELFLIQHELYPSGRDAVEGLQAYVMFNGRLFRYVEAPIVVRPEDYVRIHFLNVGPNLISTFHIVGIIWDYVYWQGYPENRLTGGQTVTAGPSDSWTIEFRIPPGDDGAYTMLSHAVGSTSRGAIGLLVADPNADLDPHRTVLADGPEFSAEAMADILAREPRIISPFALGTHPVDEPVRFGPGTDEVRVSIVGNSFHPKVVRIAPGTRVVWTNEDVFTYLAGEFAGIHNVGAISTPEGAEGFVSPLLAHAESFSHVFETPGTYDTMCTPHPYMRGRVIVDEPTAAPARRVAPPGPAGLWLASGLAVVLCLAALAWARRARALPAG